MLRHQVRRTLVRMSENLPARLVGSVGWEAPVVDRDGFVLPSGTVTLLLGDVEGSTRAWESGPKMMEAAIVELNALVDELVGRFDGVRPVEQGEGDSFVAAFARARDGIGCALAIQRALTTAALKLRVGVHTGDVVRRDEGNYVGPAIIRTARLRNLAHGGQTVVSEATRELVADALPEGASLRDVGVHRLKDLSRPERVFQLCHPDLQAEFPALRSLDLHPHNLPIQRTTFIGRAAEIAELTTLAGEKRLVTITGSGGCGKTRLALQVAADVMEAFPAGVWLVELAAVTDADGVAAKAAQVLSVLQGPGQAPLESVVAHLADQHALIVLDNCEHVIEPAASLADAIVAGCPGVRVIATSRQPLELEGEARWRVPSLSLPPDDAGPAGIEGLGGSEAVELFVERAALARPGFTLEERHRAPVAAICRRLDGIPLAIELAAARARVLTPAQIADGLAERFRLLTGAARTALPRQQTLEASLDWSHALLTDPERAVFRRLGVFAGGFDLDAAAAVCATGGIEPWQVLDLVTLLVDKNLVAVDDTGEVARYRLLETIRHYALQRLEAAGETEAARTRHRDHYLALAETAAPYLETADSPAWFARLDLDYPNLETALQSSHQQGDNDELVRMVAALCPAWVSGGPSIRLSAGVGLRWIKQAVGHAETLSPRDRGRLLWYGAITAFGISDTAAAATMAQDGLALAEQHHDDLVRGRMLAGLALALGLGKDTARFWDDAIDALRRADDQFGLALCLSWAGIFYADRDPLRARDLCLEAIRRGNDCSSLLAVSCGRASLAQVLLNEGQVLEALRELRAAAQAAIDCGAAIPLLGAEMLTMEACGAAGDFDELQATADRLEGLARTCGVGRETFRLQGRALLAAARGDLGSAVESAVRAVETAETPYERAKALPVAARVQLAAGDTAATHARIAELQGLADDDERPFAAVQAQLLDARLKRLTGEHVTAEHAVDVALATAVDLPAFSIVVDALEALAGLAGDADSPEEAGRLLGRRPPCGKRPATSCACRSVTPTPRWCALPSARSDSTSSTPKARHCRWRTRSPTRAVVGVNGNVQLSAGTASPRPKPRSRTSSRRGARTPRSASGCSCVPGPCKRTSPGCTPSSMSPAGRNSLRWSPAERAETEPVSDGRSGSSPKRNTSFARAPSLTPARRRA